MSLLRFLGIKSESDSGNGETDTVRRIADQLDRLEPEQARFLAAFAYVLARIANADLHIDETETAEMERVGVDLAHLSSGEATLVIEIAKSQTRMLGGTENYVVTREFRAFSTREQRVQLLQCIYAVAAADGTISGMESGEIMNIAEELGFTRAEAGSLRSAYRDKLSEFQSR